MEELSYIKLFRKLTKWEWYTEPNTFKLFIHILIKANYSDKKWRGLVIERGSFVTSLQTLSVETGLSIQSVRTALAHLQQTNEIEVLSTNQNTLIKALKYDFYQGYEVVANTRTNTPINKQSTHELTNDQQTTNKQLTTTNNKKNNKNNKKYIYKENSSNTVEKSLPQWYIDEQNGVEEELEDVSEEQLEEIQRMLREMK